VRTVEMTAFYSGQAGLGLSGGGDEPSRTPSQLTRIEARNKCDHLKDGQSATGDWADLRYQGQYGAAGETSRSRAART